MPFLKPTPPPYDPLEWIKKPFAERARMVCQAWAVQGYGTPIAAYLFYAVKILFYIGGWIFFCGFTPGLGEISNISHWWLAPVAFQKAILWSMLFEGLGLGCGSGPLTARYHPPVGGFLYFLRVGTTKLPLFPGLPVLGKSRRTALDVALYITLIGVLLWTLTTRTPGPTSFALVAILVPLIGIADRTIFLALRSEHYWTTTICFLFASLGHGLWIPSAKAVMLSLWFFAGFSKLNHHFPAVVGVMTSNSPTMRLSWIRKLMYRQYPNDLRPSTLAVWMGHAGTALELGLPLVLLFSTGGTSLIVGMILMIGLHSFITSNVPMAVPIEWNFMMVYGGFALFWAHPDMTIAQISPTPLAVFLAIVLIGVPLFGNLFPQRISFLLAMRYYAGNWAYGVWLFKGDSHKKLERLTKTSPWIYDQVQTFYSKMAKLGLVEHELDRATITGVVGKVMGFRLMHLHGRVLPVVIPKTVDRLEDYEWVDGEIMGGLVLGWNFGDGRLHNEQLLKAIQEQCGFEPGELRCIFVESQPLGGRYLEYRIHDAATGIIEKGKLEVAELRERQPWEGIKA